MVQQPLTIQCIRHVIIVLIGDTCTQSMSYYRKCKTSELLLPIIEQLKFKRANNSLMLGDRVSQSHVEIF